MAVTFALVPVCLFLITWPILKFAFIVLVKIIGMFRFLKSQLSLKYHVISRRHKYSNFVLWGQLIAPLQACNELPRKVSNNHFLNPFSHDVFSVWFIPSSSRIWIQIPLRFLLSHPTIKRGHGKLCHGSAMASFEPVWTVLADQVVDWADLFDVVGHGVISV